MSEFLTISRLVTGVDDLDAALAETYRALMRGTAAAARELAALQSLAYLWYAGRLPPEGKDEAPFPTEAAYFGGLLWRVVGAHPPGLSGGYTGHWRYAPDA